MWHEAELGAWAARSDGWVKVRVRRRSVCFWERKLLVVSFGIEKKRFRGTLSAKKMQNDDGEAEDHRNRSN